MFYFQLLSSVYFLGCWYVKSIFYTKRRNFRNRNPYTHFFTLIQIAPTILVNLYHLIKQHTNMVDSRSTFHTPDYVIFNYIRIFITNAYYSNSGVGLTPRADLNPFYISLKIQEGCVNTCQKIALLLQCGNSCRHSSQLLSSILVQFLYPC